MTVVIANVAGAPGRCSRGRAAPPGPSSPRSAWRLRVPAWRPSPRISGRRRPRFPVAPQKPGTVAVAALMGLTVELVFLAVRVPLAALGVSVLLTGAGYAVFGVLWTTAMQRAVPEKLWSRVFSVESVGTFALYPVGTAAASGGRGLRTPRRRCLCRSHAGADHHHRATDPRRPRARHPTRCPHCCRPLDTETQRARGKEGDAASAVAQGLHRTARANPEQWPDCRSGRRALSGRGGSVPMSDPLVTREANSTRARRAGRPACIISCRNGFVCGTPTTWRLAAAWRRERRCALGC